MSSNEEEAVTKVEAVAEGARSAARDHALVRLDEVEVKARVLAAFDAFLTAGFRVHLIGELARGAVLYKLLLVDDGVEDMPIRDVQKIADEHRLDIFYERGEGLALYARW